MADWQQNDMATFCGTLHKPSPVILQCQGLADLGSMLELAVALAIHSASASSGLQARFGSSRYASLQSRPGQGVHTTGVLWKCAQHSGGAHLQN